MFDHMPILLPFLSKIISTLPQFLVVQETSQVAQERWSGVEVLIRTAAQIPLRGTEIEGDPHQDLHLQVCIMLQFSTVKSSLSSDRATWCYSTIALRTFYTLVEHVRKPFLYDWGIREG